MKAMTEIRRENLRAVVEKNGGVTKVSKVLGYTNASFLSQQIGPNPTREITEKSARAYEQKLGLPVGTLDGRAEVSAPATAGDLSLVATTITLVGSVLKTEAVETSIDRFAQIVALALQDAAEHGGHPREGRIRDVVKLLK